MELAGKVSEAAGPTEEEGGKSNKEEEGERGGGHNEKEQVEEGVEGESPSSQAASSFPSMTSSRCQTTFLPNASHSHFQQVPQCRLSDPRS